MRVIVAEYSGFCFGVRRAVRLVERALKERNGPIYSLGPFIHNPQVVEKLSRRGLRGVKDLKRIKGGSIVIRSHGLHPCLIKEAKRKRMNLVDATCPHVKKAQAISKTLRDKGYLVIIVGEKEHPEVHALRGFANDEAVVVNGLTEVRELALKGRRIGILAQTTQSRPRFLKIVSAILEKGPVEINVFDTICNDTVRRQRSAFRVAKSVDLMLILGGHGSANTRRLAEICGAIGTKVRHIEVARELKARWLKGKKVVGIAGGASTPDWIINDVVRRLRNFV